MHAETCWHSHLSFYTQEHWLHHSHTHTHANKHTHIHTDASHFHCILYNVNLQLTAVWHGHMLWLKAHFYLRGINMITYMKDIIYIIILENKESPFQSACGEFILFSTVYHVTVICCYILFFLPHTDTNVVFTERKLIMFKTPTKQIGSASKTLFHAACLLLCYICWQRPASCSQHRRLYVSPLHPG